MSNLIKDIEQLANEIGPRPAGTEEERQAAMYIGDSIKSRSGLSYKVEDFEGARGKSRATQICAVISAVIIIAAVLIPVITWPAFVVALVVAFIGVMEFLEKPIISNFIRFGISQNVVAKFEPGFSPEKQKAKRKRKIILISHYDSGHSVNGNSESVLSIRSILKHLSLASCCLIVLVLLLKAIFLPQPTGSTFLLFVAFAVILALLAVIPLILDFLESRSDYSDGANCNASGNAALIEIARRLTSASYVSNDFEADKTTVIHGEKDAEEKGVIPEDTNVEYNVGPVDPLEVHEKNLADAKAAVEAFTSPIKVKEPEEEEQQDNVEEEHNENVPDYKTKQHTGDTPSWYKSAQSKSKPKEEDEDLESDNKRSRFAHTMDFMAKRQEDEKKKIEAEKEAERAKLRERIIEAQKAAEEERKKQFGDDKPFVETKEENKKLSIEEAFNRKPTEIVKVVKEENQITDIPEMFVPKDDEDKTEFMPPVKAPEDTKQYAPLDDEKFISSNELPKNSSMIDLPEVYSDKKIVESKKEDEETKEVKKGKFGTGSFKAVADTEGMAGSTGSFAPVSEELIEDAVKSGEADSSSMIVDDADDDVFKEGNYTDKGAFAGSSYVQMPDKKRGGLFGFFKKKNKEEESSLTDEWEGGGFADNVRPVSDFGNKITTFHNQNINLDVWLVALGSEVKENAGIKSFLIEHAHELKGAILVDIEGIGCGDLSLVESEGYLFKSKTSMRIKRYVKKAAQSLDMNVPSINIPWFSSSASYANKQGFKTIKLIGSDGKKPSFYLQNDDVVDNINEETLNKNIDYIIRLIQCI